MMIHLRVILTVITLLHCCSDSLAQGAPAFQSTPDTSIRLGRIYSYAPAISGMPAPTFSFVTSPDGMQLDNQTGAIRWLPTRTGYYWVILVAENEYGQDRQVFAIHVRSFFDDDDDEDEEDIPRITSSPITQIDLEDDYEYKVSATNRPDFSLIEAPEGMSIRRRSGVIKWQPEGPGAFSVTVVAENDNGVDFQSFTIQVRPPTALPEITSSPPRKGETELLYQYDVEATGLPSPVFELLSAPPEMRIESSSGLIEWSSPTEGEHTIEVEARNQVGSDIQSFVLDVSKRRFAPVITSNPLTDAFTDEPYQYSVQVDAYPEPSFELRQRPRGMQIDAQSGKISWLPPETGVFDVVVQVTNSEGRTQQDFQVTVSRQAIAPDFSSSPLTQTLLGEPYQYQLEASGYPVPVFSLLEGPAGMNLDAETGLLRWVPGSLGVFEVLLEASNVAGSVTQSFALTVDAAGSEPLVYQPAVRMVSPRSVNLTMRVNPNGSPTRVRFEYGVDRVNEFELEGTPGIVDGRTEQRVVASLEDLEEGVTYRIRAIAENDAGLMISPEQNFTTYANTYQIGTTYSFNGALDSLRYRLFSVPGLVDLDVGSTLTGTQDEDWGVFHDNGEVADFLESYDGSEIFRFRPGKGFWVLSNTRWHIEGQAIQTVPINEIGLFQSELHAGWNIIASPFLEPIAWQDVILASGSHMTPGALLWAFDGTFQEADSLKPYEAYYYFHPAEAGLLSVPFPGLWRPSYGTETNKKDPAAFEVALTIEASIEEQAPSRIGIGFHTEARTGLDSFDQYAPRGHFAPLQLRLQPDFDAPYGLLAREVRPSTGNGSVHTLVLDAPKERQVTLRAEQHPALNRAVYLVDQATGAFHDLGNGLPLSFYPQTDQTILYLVTGTEQFIDEQRTLLLPTRDQLYQNYPNPFSTSTTIGLSLAQPAVVRVEIYDLLGRLVEQLVHQELPAGFHEIQWNMRRHFPSGVYMVQMHTENGTRQSLPITLVH